MRLISRTSPLRHSTLERRVSGLAFLSLAARLSLLIAISPAALAAEGPLKKSDFEDRLSQPVVAQVNDAELRPFVASMAQDREIPFVFDRRLDASRAIAWEFNGEPFFSAINERMTEVGAGARTVGLTLYLGPDQQAAKLRTLIALRQEELKRLSRWPAQRRIAAQARHRVDWGDAEDPRDLLKEISKRWALPLPPTIELPADLWAEGSMVGVDAAEALSLILIQFDRTFRWNEEAPGLEIVPIPEAVTIERRHKVPRNRIDGLVEKLAATVPSAHTSLNGSELLVRGTLEDHEAVETLLSPTSSHPPGKVRPGDPILLSERRFTVTAEQVTVRDAIKAVEAYGITIEIDEDALTQAGIKLDRRIDLRLQMATIDQLLGAICNPVGLKYEIDGFAVTLSPRPARGESPLPK